MITTRKPHVWKCQLLGHDGSTVEVRLTAYWDPERVSAESVAQAAAAMETVKGKHKTKYSGLAATLVED